MKKIFLFYFIIMLGITINAQVNFDLDFTLLKNDANDKINNLWFDDLNNDGTEEIYLCCSNSETGSWYLNSYDFDGNLLSNYEANDTDFLNCFLWENNSTIYLFTSYKKEIFYDDVLYYYLDINAYDFGSQTLIDSIRIEIGHNVEEDIIHGYYTALHDVNYFHINEEQDIPILLVGLNKMHYSYSYDTSSTHYYSDILKISFSEESFNSIETIHNIGSQLIDFPGFDSYICLGYGNQYAWWGEFAVTHKEFYVSAISKDIVSEVNELVHLLGNIGYWGIDNYPEYLKILNSNDNNFSSLLINYKILNNNSTTINTINFSSNLSDTLWNSSIEYDEIIQDNNIISSTCIDVNQEPHYVLYFTDNNFLEIMDRDNGNIILTQESDIIPNKILSDSNEELHFIVFEENCSEIRFYNLLEYIQVHSDNNSINDVTFALSNFPNPFNPTTTIAFSIQNDSNVEISVFNIKGQKIKTLVNSSFTKGSHSIIWNGDNNLGKPVSSGVYMYKLVVDGDTEAVKKCILLK